jgi:uncharacterized protein YbjT (DUF2867 family)
VNEPILVTGASGNVGREVVKALLAKGERVRGTAVNEADAKGIPGEGTEIVFFDFGNPQSYEPAFAGVKKMFLMRPPMISDVETYIKPVIQYATSVGVEQIAFLSLVGVENKSYVPHYKVEKYLEESGIAYTFLRAGFFMQNLDTTHRLDIIEHNDLFIPAGKAKTAFIDARDIGAVAAHVLTTPGHENKAYELTGSEALTYYQVADIFSEVLGRKISYSKPSMSRFAWRMHERGYPWGYVGVMSGLYLTTRFGAAEKVADDVAVLLNRPPITLRQYVRDYAAVWQVNSEE